jgi:hypothetical protein
MDNLYRRIHREMKTLYPGLSDKDLMQRVDSEYKRQTNLNQSSQPSIWNQDTGIDYGNNDNSSNPVGEFFRRIYGGKD